MRVAVVGAGISGLVAAHRLSRDHEVTVFEANDYPGGHTHTIPVTVGDETHDVDTGFIVYNERNYPNFTALLDEPDVATQPSCMSFSVRCDRTGLEYNGTSLNKLFAQRSNLLRPRFHRMLRDILRFNRDAAAIAHGDDDRTGGEDTRTVGDFLDDGRYGRDLVERYLVPMGSAIWSCPPGRFRGFPIQFVADFFSNHGMLAVSGRPQWRVIRGGSHRYVDVLIRRFADRLHLSSPVRRIDRHPDRVVLRLDDDEAAFDHVVVACHSDQALAMLDRPSPVERELLGAFAYQPNEVILHTDASVLPRRKLAWASWNYRLRAGAPEQAVVTYNMNILQGLDSKHVFCVTLNDGSAIDPERVIRRLTYHHPLYGPGQAAAQRRHGELLDANRTSFCGAYWGYGFHEDGVNSGLAVASALTRAREAAA